MDAAHRQTELHHGLQGGGLGRVQAAAQEAEGCVEAVAPQHGEGDQRLRPHDDGCGDAAADGTQRRHGDIRQAGQAEALDQKPAQRHLQRQAGDLQGHHRLRSRHRRVEAAIGGEQQGRRQAEGQRPQIAAHLGLDLGAGLGNRQEGIGEQQHRIADQHQAQGQPDRLVQLIPGSLQLVRAVELADDGRDRHHHAHQADEDGHVDGGADRQRRQIGGRMAGHQHGVDGGEAQHGHLADEHRPGQRRDAAQAVEMGQEVLPFCGWSRPLNSRARSA